MVRPNQIIKSNLDNGELTFLMFARSESQVKRRVLLINFPSVAADLLMSDASVDDYISNVRQVTSGRVNRYAVTVDTDAL